MLSVPEWIQNVDEQLLSRIAETLRTPVLDSAMVFLTGLGDGGLIFILVAMILLFFRRTRSAGCSALASLGVGVVVVNMIIKPLVSRPRPYLVMEGLTVLLPSPDGYSFPSGHTNAAFAFAAALCLTLPRECRAGKWAALAGACLMGFSRLYVGVHFPSDVLGGAATGTAAALIGCLTVKAVSEKIKNRRQDPQSPPTP